MKFTYCLSSFVFFVYFSVVVLVIVNGQPTTDDDIDKQEISELISVVAELREELAKVKGELASVKAEHAKTVAQVGKLEDQLAAAVDKIDTQKDAGKLNALTLLLSNIFC